MRRVGLDHADEAQPRIAPDTEIGKLVDAYNELKNLRM
jgi:hypothetical protein